MNSKLMKAVQPIIILGSGPAGISTAVEAIKKGYSSEDILILEKSNQISSMIVQKYPDDKPVLANYKGRLAECIGDMCITDMSKVEFVDYIKNIVIDKKINIHFNQHVKKIIKLKNSQFSVQTMTDTYLSDTVFVAIGNMSSPRTLGINIASPAAEFLFYDLQQMSLKYKDVLVVGGGDSAGEYAKILTTRGHQVTLSYRGDSFNKMAPANEKNTNELIKSGKIKFIPHSNLKKVEWENQKIKAIFDENEIEPVFCHSIVAALGAERPVQYLKSVGITTEIEGETDIFNESKMGGLFFVGDLAAGKSGGTINFAFNSGVKAVNKACSLYLDCDED